MGYSARDKPSAAALKNPARRNAWAILALAVLQPWETCGKGASAPSASEDFTIRAETVVNAARTVAWSNPFLSVSMAERSDKTIRGLLSKTELVRLFPTSESVLGPACRVSMRVYGRDITYPIKTPVVAAMLEFFKQVDLHLGRLARIEMGYSMPAPVEVKEHHAGLQELKGTLPGPPSFSCEADFPAADFQSMDLWWDKWYGRDTISAMFQPTGVHFEGACQAWVRKTMAELGFPQTHYTGPRMIYQPASLQVNKARAFIPYERMRFTLMMQSPCLFPMTLEKQTALQSVLEDLLVNTGILRFVHVEQVTYVPPIVDQVDSAAPHVYFFVNASILLATYIGNPYKNLSEAFGARSPFRAAHGGGPSAFQKQMEQVGLPVVTVKTAAHEILRKPGKPVLTPVDSLIVLEEAMALRQKLICAGLGTVVALTGALLARIGFFGRAQERQSSLIETIDSNSFRGQIPHEGSLSMDEPSSMSLTEALLQQMKPPGLDEDEAVPELQVPTVTCKGDLLGSWLSRGTDSSSSCCSNSTGSEGKQNASSHVLPALWDTDFIQHERLEAAKRQGSLWILGSSPYGQVIKGILDGVHDVALKISKADVAGEVMLNEIALLKSCRHSNIVQSLGACLFNGALVLVMEYLPGGDLRSFLNQQRTWTWNRRAAAMALDIARGLAYLHSQKVVHMDLKSSNVLLTEELSAKLSDMGISQLLTGSRTHCTNQGKGTLAYVAPEIILDGKAVVSSDMFSFGVILWELVTGEVPIRGRMREIRAPEECPVQVAELMCGCLSMNPCDRPTAKLAAVTLARLLEEP